MTQEQDPVFQDDYGAWNFWDETWAYFHGPFETEEKAREAWQRYSRWADGGRSAVQ